MKYNFKIPPFPLVGESPAAYGIFTPRYGPALTSSGGFSFHVFNHQIEKLYETSSSIWGLLGVDEVTKSPFFFSRGANVGKKEN
jgi:hypothetical protein